MPRLGPGFFRSIGYSGTAILTRMEPLNVTYGFGDDLHRHEGRVITAEYEDFYLVCCYTPNAQNELKRLDYRMDWEDSLREYLTVECFILQGDETAFVVMALYVHAAGVRQRRVGGKDSCAGVPLERKKF